MSRIKASLAQTAFSKHSFMVVSQKVKMSISQITQYDQHVLCQLPGQTIYLIIMLSVTDNIG